MPTTIYDSSLITKRAQNKTIANSFINRIQNGNNSTTGSAPILGITEQSIINSIKTGQMIDFRKNEGGCTIMNTGCPCNPISSPSPSPAPAPTPTPSIRGWATSIQGPGNDNGNGIATDSYGNVYVTGFYSSTLTIYNFVSGGGGGAINITPYGTLSNSGNQDIFIVKYNTDGFVQWVTSIQGTGNEIGYSIATDKDRNVYVIGSYTSTTTINSVGSVGGGVISVTEYGTLTNNGNQDIFVVKYNEFGFVQWATSIQGTGSDTGYSIATDKDNNVYVTGYHTSPLLTINNFVSGGGGGAISVTAYGTLSNNTSNDVFIVKYNTSGSALWATSIQGNNDIVVRSIATDSSGNVYVTGFYISTSLTINNFDSVIPGGAISVTTYGTLSNNIGEFRCFIVKYNEFGIAQWATSIQGNGSNSGNSITTDKDRNVYVTGVYSSPLLTINSFVSGGGGGVISVTSYGTLSNSASNDMFIVKYNEFGIAQWATSIQGSSTDIGYGIATDSSGNVYVTGSYTSTSLTINSFSSVGGGAISVTAYGTLPNMFRNIVVIKYNTNGLAQWATSIQGITTIEGARIATDSSGNVYITGVYSSPLLTINTFSSNPVIPGGVINIIPYGTLSNSGSGDVFVVKYDTNGQIL